MRATTAFLSSHSASSQTPVAALDRSDIVLADTGAGEDVDGKAVSDLSNRIPVSL